MGNHHLPLRKALQLRGLQETLRDIASKLGIRMPSNKTEDKVIGKREEERLSLPPTPPLAAFIPAETATVNRAIPRTPVTAETAEKRNRGKRKELELEEGEERPPSPKKQNKKVPLPKKMMELDAESMLRGKKRAEKEAANKPVCKYWMEGLCTKVTTGLLI